MAELSDLKGACLCQAVSFTAKNVNSMVGACHCDMCRAWGGGPFMGVDCKTEVKFEGAQHITTYQSSEWAERGFCSRCGSHLFYKLSQSGQFIMPVGLFNEQDQFVFDHQVFIDQKPAYYHFANKTEDMTGEEVFAKFAGG